MSEALRAGDVGFFVTPDGRAIVKVLFSGPDRYIRIGSTRTGDLHNGRIETLTQGTHVFKIAEPQITE